MKRILLTGVLITSSLLIRAQDSTKIQQFIKEWFGKPYRFGGESKRGIDCSAFVQRFYRDVVGLAIPRTCYYQRLSAIPVSIDSLLPGDILFFTSKVSPSGKHAGIYIGEGQFIHAANIREGVKISCLDEPMYRRLFSMAGRYK